MSGSGTEQKSVLDKLRNEGRQELQNAHEKYAIALAVEEGEITPEKADGLLEMDELAVVQSDYYPGDEFYDRAAAQLRRQL